VRFCSARLTNTNLKQEKRKLSTCGAYAGASQFIAGILKSALTISEETSWRAARSLHIVGRPQVLIIPHRVSRKRRSRVRSRISPGREDALGGVSEPRRPPVERPRQVVVHLHQLVVSRRQTTEEPEQLVVGQRQLVLAARQPVAGPRQPVVWPGQLVGLRRQRVKRDTHPFAREARLFMRDRLLLVKHRPPLMRRIPLVVAGNPRLVATRRFLGAAA
jgi:hypothetical protein